MSSLFESERQPPPGSALNIVNTGSWGGASVDTRSTKSSKKSKGSVHPVVLSRATTHAMVAASSIIGAGGNEQAAIDTAKAAALAVLVDSDGSHGSSRGFLSRRKAKQQAEIIAGMAYLSICQQMQQEQMSSFNTAPEQNNSTNPFWFNPLTSQQQPPKFVRQQSEASRAVSSIGTYNSYQNTASMNHRPERFLPSLPTVPDVGPHPSDTAPSQLPPPPPPSEPNKKLISPRDRVSSFWKNERHSTGRKGTEDDETENMRQHDALLSNSESNDTYGDDTINKLYDEDPFLQALTSVFTCGMSGDPKVSHRKRRGDNPMSVASADFTADDTIDPTTEAATQYLEDRDDDDEYKIGSHSSTDSHDVIRHLNGSNSSEGDGNKRGLSFWRRNKDENHRVGKKESLHDTVVQALSGGTGCAPRYHEDADGNEYYADMDDASPHVFRVTGYSNTTTPKHHRFRRWKNLRKQQRHQEAISHVE